MPSVFNASGFLGPNRRTDVWALGCCLYSLAFLQNCFEEGSNLAILSRKYTIPEDNPYGEGLVELLDRMLTVDSKARADMTEVILCLSAVYSGRPLPPRKKSSKSKKDEKDGKEGEEGADKEADKEKRVGTFRTDGQGVQEVIYDPTKVTEGKKLASNSVAARRKRAAAGGASKPPTAPTSSASPCPAPAAAVTSEPLDFGSFHSRFSDKSGEGDGDQNAGFSAGFGDMKGEDRHRSSFNLGNCVLTGWHILNFVFGIANFFNSTGFETQSGDAGANDFFGSFDGTGEQKSNANDAFAAAFDSGGAWGDTNAALSDATPAADFASGEKSEEFAVGGSGDGEDGGEDRKKDSPDASRRGERSRRRKTGTSSRNSRASASDPDGVEPNPSGDGGDPPKKDRRSRRSSNDGQESSRRRSGSRSKRKGRGQRESGRSESGRSDDDAPKAGGSFRGQSAQ